MLEARVRQVLYECQAEIVRDTMRDQQVTSGRSVRADHHRSIFPELKESSALSSEDRIRNEFSVIYGPGRKYDRSDADRCWIITQITKAEHRRRFGDKSLLNRTDFADFGDFSGDWIGLGKRNEMVQIAEKFEKEYGPEDPDTGERTWTVCRYVLNGAEILSKEDALTDDIGIVPEWGREKVVDGIQRHFSLINPAKDPQRLVNLYVSNIAQEIAGVPHDRFEAPYGSIAQKDEDAYASNSPAAIRWYKQWDDQGRQLNKPEPGTREAPIQALTEGLMQAIDAIKAAMGIFDASMGERSNEVSGIAQKRRQVESEITNFHFQGNETRSWNRIGQIVLKYIFKLDAGKKQIPVRHPDGKTEMVPLGTEYADKNGKNVTHTLDDPANYGVHVEQGISYQRAQEESEEWQQGLITAAPELLFTGVGVSFLRNSGKPGADEQADALEAYINMKTPGLIPSKDGAPPIPPQAQAQIQGLQQKLQVTTAFAQKIHEEQQRKTLELQAKAQETAADNDVKLKIAQMQEDTKRVLGLAALNAQQAETKLDAELGITSDKLDRTHDLHMKLVDQAHATQQQQAGAEQDARSQLADQAQQSQQADAERQAQQAQAAGGEQ